MIKIVCDSMSDIPNEILKKYDIDVIPLTINFEGEEYKDGVDITNKEFYKMLKSSKSMPKTSQVTYAQFDDFFSRYKNDEILYIGGSSRASGTFQSAVMAKNEGYDNVCVFDTENLSIGSALFVIKACEMREQGFTVKEIIDKLNSLKGTENVLFSVDTLEYLKLGGRISSTKAMVGSLLNIKPILYIENGLVSQKSQVRGKKQVFSSLLNGIAESNSHLEDSIVILGYGDNDVDLETLKTYLNEKYKVKELYCVNIGCAICSHCGPGILGISCI